MRIMLTGGGTGGHVTPLRAIAAEIKQADPKTIIYFVGQRGDRFSKMFAQDKDIFKTRYIFAGKFRRYHGVPIWRQLIDIPTIVLNMRDGLLVLLGVLQSLFIILRLKPDVVFIKGGYVGVPVGLTAAALGKRIITHDSDALPGLANKLVSKWVSIHAVGLPPENYSYPKQTMRYVGVPVSSALHPIGAAARGRLRRKLGFKQDHKIILVTGGSLGAKNINTALLSIAKDLLADDKIALVHITGRDQFEIVRAKLKQILDKDLRRRYRILPYVSENMHEYSGAADIIVSRAGGSSVAEFAAQKKAVILIPNPMLTGGHQLKNAAVYQRNNAALVLNEQEICDNPALLLEATSKLLADKDAVKKMSSNLYALSKPDSSRIIAKLILKH